MDKEVSQLSFGFGEAEEFLTYLAVSKTDDGFEPSKEPDPTDAEPGSWEKVEVLASRLANGEILWSDGDKKIDLSKKEGASFIDIDLDSLFVEEEE